MSFLKCFCYLMASAVFWFLAGRILPQKWLLPHGFLFRCRDFEKNGKIYEKVGIRKWQNKVPDMSKLLPRWMPPKNLSGDYAARLPVMIQETCVAELVHILVTVSGLYCLHIWRGIGGIIVTLIHTFLLNLPYILIQRYNRPRLMRLYQKRNAKSFSPIHTQK